MRSRPRSVLVAARRCAARVAALPRHRAPCPACCTRAASTATQPQPSQPQPSPSPLPPPKELVRDFIWRALYDARTGYFATTPCLHAPVAPLEFAELRGKAEYTQQLAQLYAAEDEAWLTPVEIFAVRATPHCVPSSIAALGCGLTCPATAD
jgi:hypothetical protein